MTSASLTLCDDALRPVLAHMNGARIDAAHFIAQTGLVVVALHARHNMLLGVGIGPVVSGVGVLPRLPHGRSGIEHPLVAAMRAHLVGSYVDSIDIEDGTIWITAQGANHLSPENVGHLSGEVTYPPARLALEPGPRGSARVMIPSGAVVTWPANQRQVLGTPTKFVGRTAEISIESAGTMLVDASDAYRIEAYHRELVGILRQKRQRLERRALAVQQDLARLDDVPHLQKIGSLLLAQGKTIPRGTTQAKLVDWDTNERIVIALSPDKPVQEQATEFFQRARRWQRGAAIMQKRLEETERAIEALEPLEIALHDAPADWNVLREIAQRMHSAGFSLPAPTSVGSVKPRASEERKPYHTFRSTNAAVIWVGRSGPDNDELVTRFARPHDLWLHSKNTRGAHVVVPLEKNRSCPADVLVDAATLAAHFSDARNESTCEVSYVERRYVRKPKKSAPGSVTTQREKVLVVRVEKDRLARLLGSKVET